MPLLSCGFTRALFIPPPFHFAPSAPFSRPGGLCCFFSSAAALSRFRNAKVGPALSRFSCAAPCKLAISFPSAERRAPLTPVHEGSSAPAPLPNRGAGKDRKETFFSRRPEKGRWTRSAS